MGYLDGMDRVENFGHEGLVYLLNVFFHHFDNVTFLFLLTT